ncbi:MAG: hypothetical protein ACREHG_05915, partial [Candidatus Saccharimonadales bacterium]
MMKYAEHEREGWMECGTVSRLFSLWYLNLRKINLNKNPRNLKFMQNLSNQEKNTVALLLTPSTHLSSMAAASASSTVAS